MGARIRAGPARSRCHHHRGTWAIPGWLAGGRVVHAGAFSPVGARADHSRRWSAAGEYYDIKGNPICARVVATFTNVFPHATLWMAGEGDLLMIGRPINSRAAPANVERGLCAAESVRAGPAVDSRVVAVRPAVDVRRRKCRRRASGAGAALSGTTTAMPEFSAPLALHTRDQRQRLLRSLDVAVPPEIVNSRLGGCNGSRNLRILTILRQAGAFEAAYDAAATRSGATPQTREALQSLVEASAPLARQADAMGLLSGAVTDGRMAPRLALSRLHAATGQIDPATMLVSGCGARGRPAWVAGTAGVDPSRDMGRCRTTSDRGRDPRPTARASCCCLLRGGT